MSEETTTPLAEVEQKPISATVIKLTRDHVAKAKDIKLESVDVPEWLPEDAPDGAVARVWVKTMSAGRREQYLNSIRKFVTNASGDISVEMTREFATAKLLVMVTVDEEGNPIFTDADVSMLNDKSSKAAERIQVVASRLNGLDDNAIVAAKNDSAPTRS